MAHRLIKLLRTCRRHYDHTYTEGLNVCAQPWKNGWASGGLYACELRHLFEWITLYPDITEVAWVDVPADAQVARFPTKIKASALVLTGFMPIAEAVALAIQGGADVYTGDALRWASEHGHLSVVEVLVKACPDDDALRLASENGYLPIVKLLVHAGVDVHAMGNMALRMASYYGHLPVVEFLVQAGADVHADDDYALRYASSSGHLPIVKFLVTAGANVHTDDDEALRWASKYGHLDVVEFLVTAGATTEQD